MIIFLDQHCSGGQGARKIARGEVSSDIFCIVRQTKKQQNEVFFQVVLARIVATERALPQEIPLPAIPLVVDSILRCTLDFDINFLLL